MTEAEEVQRYMAWGLAVVAGAIMAAVDRRWIGRPVLAVGLILLALAGLIGMQLNPFSFASGDAYMECVIATGAALLALTGYALAWVASFVAARFTGGRKP